jgi:hypothetical protein
VFDVLRSDVFNHVFRDVSLDNSSQPNSCGDFSPHRFLFAYGTVSGLRFWDIASTKELAFAPIGMVRHLRFDQLGNLLTIGENFYRWPVQRVGSSPEVFRFGPPHKVPVSVFVDFSISRDGGVLAVSQYDGATIVHADRPNQPVHVGPHWDCRDVAVSPSGRYVATGSHFGSQVKVWNSSDGQLLTTLPIDGWAVVSFSPDERWLTTKSVGGQLWRVGSWEAGPTTDGNPSGFSPDGRMLAVDSLTYVRLVDPETGAEYVKLEHPNGHQSLDFVFSADETLLVATNTGRKSNFAWNLQRLREKLDARGLDLDLPPYPSLKVPTDPVPITVKILTSQPAPESAVETARANIERFRSTIAADPNSVTALNGLAWILATGPDELRDAKEAVALAEKAASLQPHDTNLQNTFGVACYRAGQYREAIDHLASNLSEQTDDSLPYDLYFLAMSYHQLGETDRARDYLIWANRWLATHPPDDASTIPREVESFRAEAEALIQ